MLTHTHLNFHLIILVPFFISLRRLLPPISLPPSPSSSMWNNDNLQQHPDLGSFFPAQPSACHWKLIIWLWKFIENSYDTHNFWSTSKTKINWNDAHAHSQKNKRLNEINVMYKQQQQQNVHPIAHKYKSSNRIYLRGAHGIEITCISQCT